MAGSDKRFPVDFSQLLASGSLSIFVDDGAQSGYIKLADIVAFVVEQMSGTTNGSGITFSLDGRGHLISHNNGTMTDLGQVVGGKGTDGDDGADGVSVVAAAIDARGNLIFTLGNGATLDAGSMTTGFVITNGMVKQALGYTPYDAANPSKYQTDTEVQARIEAAPAKLFPASGKTVTDGASYSMQLSDYIVAVDKAIGSPTEIVLPQNPEPYRLYNVSDAKRDAGTNNIALKHNGVVIWTIAHDGWSITLYHNGVKWIFA